MAGTKTPKGQTIEVTKPVGPQLYHDVDIAKIRQDPRGFMAKYDGGTMYMYTQKGIRVKANVRDFERMVKQGYSITKPVAQPARPARQAGQQQRQQASQQGGQQRKRMTAAQQREARMAAQGRQSRPMVLKPEEKDWSEEYGVQALQKKSEQQYQDLQDQVKRSITQSARNNMNSNDINLAGQAAGYMRRNPAEVTAREYDIAGEVQADVAKQRRIQEMAARLAKGVDVGGTIKSTEKEALDVYGKGGNAFAPTGANLFNTAKRAEEILDPEVMMNKESQDALAQFNDVVQNNYEEIQRRAQIERMSVDDYIRELGNYYIGARVENLKEALVQNNIPKDQASWYGEQLKQTLIGNLAGAAVTTKGQKQIMAEARARNAAGEGYQPNWAEQGSAMAMQMAVDMPIAIWPGGAAIRSGMAAVGWGGRLAAAKAATRAANGTIMQRALTGLMPRMFESGLNLMQYKVLSTAGNNYATDVHMTGSEWAHVAGSGFAEGVALGGFCGLFNNVVGKFGRGVRNVDDTFWQKAAAHAKSGVRGAGALAAEGAGLHIGGAITDPNDESWTWGGYMKDITMAAFFKLTPERAIKTLRTARDIARQPIKGISRAWNSPSEAANQVFTPEARAEIDAARKMTGSKFFELTDKILEATDKLAKGKEKGISEEDIKALQEEYNKLTSELSWDTQNAINTVYFGRSMAGRPRMQSIVKRDGKLYEVSKDGQTLSIYKPTDAVDEANWRQMKKRQRNQGDVETAFWVACQQVFAKVRAMDKQDPEFRAYVDAFFAATRLERSPRNMRAITDGKSDLNDAFMQFVLNQSEFYNRLHAEGLSDEVITDILHRNVSDLDDADMKTLAVLYKISKEYGFPKGELHTEQAAVDGANAAEAAGMGTEEPKVEVVRKVNEQINQAQVELGEFISSDEAGGLYNDYIKTMTPEEAYVKLLESYTEEQLAPIAKYLNALSAQKGFVERTEASIEENAADWHDAVKYNEGTEGKVVRVTDSAGKVYYIKAGKYTIQDGKLVTDGVGVLLISETGEHRPSNGRDIASAEEIGRDDAIEMKRQQLKAKSDAAMAQPAPEAAAEPKAEAKAEAKAEGKKAEPKPTEPKTEETKVDAEPTEKPSGTRERKTTKVNKASVDNATVDDYVATSPTLTEYGKKYYSENPEAMKEEIRKGASLTADYLNRNLTAEQFLKAMGYNTEATSAEQLAEWADEVAARYERFLDKPERKKTEAEVKAEEAKAEEEKRKAEEEAKKKEEEAKAETEKKEETPKTEEKPAEEEKAEEKPAETEEPTEEKKEDTKAEEETTEEKTEPEEQKGIDVSTLKHDDTVTDENGNKWKVVVRSDGVSMRPYERDRDGNDTFHLNVYGEKPLSEWQKEHRAESVEKSKSDSSDPMRTAMRIAKEENESRTRYENPEWGEKEERRRRPIRNRVTQLAKHLGIKVKMIERLEDIEDPYTRMKVEKALEKGRVSEGWTHINKDGSIEIQVFMPHLGRNNVDVTVFHESVGHYGIRKLMGEKYDKFLDKVWKSMSEDAQAYYSKIYESAEDITDPIERQRAAADEYLAFQAERMDIDMAWWQKVAAAVRRALGLRNVSDNDIRDTIRRSYQNLRKNAEVESSGGMETGNGVAQTRFSTHSIMSGGGFISSVIEDGLEKPMEDAEGNVIMKFTDDKGKERIFSGKNLVTVKDLKAMPMSALKYLIEDAMTFSGLSQKRADMLYQKYADILNTYLTIGLKENGGSYSLQDRWKWLGDTIFRTVASNGDKQYGWSLDITRICKKNEAVINTISSLQRRQGYGATPAQIMDIYIKTKEKGYQVPCPVCYVFSRYIRNGKYATAAIRGFEEYGKHLSGQAEEWTVEQWVEEMDRLKDFYDKNKKSFDNANQDITVILDGIDKLGRKLQDPRRPEKEKAEIRKKIEQFDERYRKALEVVSHMSKTNWIKSFVLRQEGKGENTVWKMREDVGMPEDMEEFANCALDLRLTGFTMRKYPGIQRLRKSGGAAAGKEITQASNNELGEIICGVGTSEPQTSVNYYQMACDPNLSPEERAAARDKAKKRFEAARLYAQKQSLRGGQRMWSWSDNIEALAPDVAINMMQMEMLGGAVQSYSKQLEGINLVSRMGAYVNGSLMAKGAGYQEVVNVVERDGKKYLAEDITESYTEYTTEGPRKRERVLAQAGSPIYEYKGKQYVAIFDDVIGIDPHGRNGKMGLFDLNKTLDKAGNIMVGMNDLHIRTCLNDDRIFFVIPWHASGQSTHILGRMLEELGSKITGKDATDYTNMQEEKDFYAKDDSGKYKHINKKAIQLWEDIRKKAESYKRKDGKVGFACGIEGGVDSSGRSENGRTVITESQIHYRELRKMIFDGTIDDAENASAKAEVLADEFLSQTYNTIKERVRDGKMTNGDNEFVYPYEYWDTTSTYNGSKKTESADVNGLRYMEYCRRLGFRPKFSGKWGKGESWTDEGNFTNDKGYWKLLIDRRMYDVNGKFQDLTSIDSSGFSPDLVDPLETSKKFEVTQVADDAKADEVAGEVYELEGKRTANGMPTVDYKKGEGLSSRERMVESVKNYEASRKKSGKLMFRVSPKEEKAYSDAVENADKTAVKKLIIDAAEQAMPNSKVRDKKGNLRVFYHGTVSKEQFNVFDSDAIFTISRPNLASQYTHKRRALSVDPMTSGRVMPVFVNLENPLIVDANRRLWNNIKVDWSDKPVSTEDIIKYAKENGYDGVIINKVRDNMFNDDTSYGDEAIAFDSSQVKSTGPSYEQVKKWHYPWDTYDALTETFGPTYDDNGKLIPLSERFNPDTPDIRFSIGGEHGARGNEAARMNLDTAKEMEKKGKDAKAIWLATGWEKGKDGKWRFEIPDAKAKAVDPKKVKTIEDVVDAPELFEAYPELKEYKVEFRSIKDAGWVNHKDKLIVLDLDYNTSFNIPDKAIDEVNDKAFDWYAQNPTASYRKYDNYRKKLLEAAGERTIDEEGLKTILHEMQHVVQNIEGFAKGGNSHVMAKEWLKENTKGMPGMATFIRAFGGNSQSNLIKAGKEPAIRLLKTLFNDAEYAEDAKALAKMLEKMSSRNYEDFVRRAKILTSLSKRMGALDYERLAGEVEARNVERRLGMTDEERRNTPLSETEDRRRDDQIVREARGLEDLKPKEREREESIANEMETGTTLFRVEDDPKVVDELNKGKKVVVYRAMVEIDGKLYPPMSSKTDKKTLRNPEEIGVWQRSEENPSIAVYKKKKDGEGYYVTIIKDNGETVDVAYNPYFHSSTTMLNDQFMSAQSRPNLVVVRCEVPESELSGEYHADMAKDPVGMMDWKAGPIQGKLTGTRNVMLSRWIRPVEIVPVEEVAKHIMEHINGQIDEMPSNVVTPNQRKELEKLGMKFVEADNKGRLLNGPHKGLTWSLSWKVRHGEKLTTDQKKKLKSMGIPFGEDRNNPIKAAKIIAKKNKQDRIIQHEVESFSDTGKTLDELANGSAVERATLFRMQPGVYGDLTGIQQRNQYERANNSMWAPWAEGFGDSLRPLRKMLDAIVGKGHKIRDAHDIYSKLVNHSSVVAMAQKRFLFEHVEPWEKALDAAVGKVKAEKGTDRGDSYQYIKEWTYVMSGLERNRILKIRDVLEAARKNGVKEYEDLSDRAKDIYYQKESSIDWDSLTPEEEERERKRILKESHEEWIQEKQQEWYDIVADARNLIANGDFNSYLDALDGLATELDPGFDSSHKDNDRSGVNKLVGGFDDTDHFDEQALRDMALDGFDVLKQYGDELWDRINDVNKFTIDKQYEGQLMDKSYKEHVEQMMAFYLPMRRWDKEMAEDVYAYLGADLSNTARERRIVMRAGGRKSLAEDPMAVMIQLADDSINLADLNKAKISLWRLAGDIYDPADTNPLLMRSETWYEMTGTDMNGNPIWTLSEPPVKDTMTPDEISKTITDWENDMMQKAKQGLAKKSEGKLDIGYDFKESRHQSEHAVKMWVNGKRMTVWINGDPRAAQAANGLLTKSTQMRQFMSPVNRALSALYTSFSPAFVAGNISRDRNFGMWNVFAKEGFKYAAKTQKEWFKNFWRFGKKNDLFTLYNNGKLDMNQKSHRYFKEFMDNGGKTGYTSVKRTEDYKKEIERLVNHKEHGKVYKSVRMLTMGILEEVNERAENLMRFSAYCASRDSGRSVLQSVNDAKNVSVNFNVSGSGWNAYRKNDPSRAMRINSQIAGGVAEVTKSLYIFVNPTIQSLRILKGNVFEHGLGDKRTQRAIGAFAGHFIMSMAWPTLMRLAAKFIFGEDEDTQNDYGNIAEWERRNNICLYAGNGRYLKIPLSYETGAMWELGQIASSWIVPTDRRLRSDLNPTLDIASVLTRLLPVDPLASSGNAPLVSIAPSQIAPIVQVIANRKWTGATIDNERTDYTKKWPNWRMSKYGTSEWAIDLCRWLASIDAPDGSDPRVETGPFDISPGKLEHMLEGYFGGQYKLVKNVSAMVTEEPGNPKNWPVLNRIIGEVRDENESMRINAKYKKVKEKAKEVEEKIKNYKALDDYNTNPDLKSRVIALENEWGHTIEVVNSAEELFTGGKGKKKKKGKTGPGLNSRIFDPSSDEDKEEASRTKTDIQMHVLFELGLFDPRGEEQEELASKEFKVTKKMKRTR